MHADIVRRALAAGRTSLTEFEAKQILSGFQVPVVPETRTETPDAAAAAADACGYPVVVKALGATLLHKSEKGLIRLGLYDTDSVRRAAVELQRLAGDALEGFLVQPQVQGSRELVMGLFRDPLFGPAVMFGIGGIFTETFSDVVFRLAPLTVKDAEEMLDEIRAKALLGEVRGQKPVDRAALVAALVGLSELAAACPEIDEVDINPLIAGPDGRVVAVDALITLQNRQPDSTAFHRVPPEAIGRILYPRSIAFVGASGTIGKWGHILPMSTINGGYEGKLYFVNSKGGEIAGRPVFRTIQDIPDPVDLCVVTVPAAAVMDLIPQMAEKGIRHMLLITSGFSETGKEGKALEVALVEKAREAGIWVLGPNTMGICNPHIRLYCTGSPVSPKAGSTAVVAQSGNMGTQLLAFAEKQGIGIRGFAGSGNEAMITIEDYLEGFEEDRLTESVMLYVESVKDGRRFFEAARRVSRKKPVVVLKGGRSQAGAEAAKSHTGALSTDTRMFDAMCHQAGVVQVPHSMDLLDMAAAFSSLPLPRGNRVAIMTLGGGWGVVTADLCAENGLTVPALSPEILARIDPLLPDYWSKANPVDIVGEHDMELPVTIMETLLGWDGCDAVIHLGILGRRILFGRMADAAQAADPNYSTDFLDQGRKLVRDFEARYIKKIAQLMETYEKPVFGVSLLTDQEDQTVYPVAGARYKAVFYETPERAVKAFASMMRYHQYRGRG